MKLNEEGLRKFTEIFEIKANSVILIEKKYDSYNKWCNYS